MSYSARDVIPRFAKYAGLPDGVERDGKKRFFSTRTRLHYARDRQGRVVELQSYGPHFPLATMLLTKAGKRRLWLLNGDRYRGPDGFGRTNQHNDMMREAAQKSGTPWFILPFSAMNEAGIIPDSIVPVDVEPERYEYTDRSAATLAEVPEQYREQQVCTDAAGAMVTRPKSPTGRLAYPDGEGGWHVRDWSAIHGWQSIPVTGPAYEGKLTSEHAEITPGPDGRYHWTEERHWLGASLFRASYREFGYRMVRGERTWFDETRRGLFVTGFDENEPVPLWFMSQLPKGARPSTVAEAVEALKPAEVRYAERAGLVVLRQGDVFAIPTPRTTRELRRDGTRTEPEWRNGRRPVLGTNHSATDVYVADGMTYARGYLRHSPAGRRPDHQRIKLGDTNTWHWLVRNTVPDRRSWSISGQVD